MAAAQSRSRQRSQIKAIGIFVAYGSVSLLVAFLHLWVLFLVLLLPVIWIFIPIFIPCPPYRRHRLLRVLRQAYLKEAEVRKTRAGIQLTELPGYFPVGTKLEAAALLLAQEGFKLEIAFNMDEQEATRWGVRCDRQHCYGRLTHVHPIGAFGWDIYLFSDQDGVIRGMRARPYYDGV
jgi:hypothetical protein